jgi:hypothetical protein
MCCGNVIVVRARSGGYEVYTSIGRRAGQGVRGCASGVIAVAFRETFPSKDAQLADLLDSFAKYWLNSFGVAARCIRRQRLECAQAARTGAQI